MSVDPLREVQRLARELYGELPTELSGVVHVVSAVRSGERWHVLKIGEQAPKSASDFFVLNFWRAHCDAIVTTAQIARAEPELSHELQGPLAPGLTAYRKQILSKVQRRLCVVITRGAGLAETHRMWSDDVDYLVLTSPSAVKELQGRLQAHAEVVGQPDVHVRAAIAVCRARGARCILIEAGPSTASQLYDAPAAIEHLMLSRCEAAVAPAAIGGALPADASLFAGHERLSEVVRAETSGAWRFERYTRTQSL